MAAKQIILGKEARDKLFTGVEKLALTVTTTLGPRGRNIAVDKRWDAPAILHDGISIAKEIDLEDSFENMGAQLVKEAASKTADRAGDGTTTSTLLAYELIKEGMKKMEVGINPMTMGKGIKIAVQKSISELNFIAKPLTTKEEITQVATISAADPAVGELIANAMERVTQQGSITVEKGTGFTTEVEYKEGVEFDKGYWSSSFINKKEESTCEIEDSLILLTDLPLDNPLELLQWLDTIIDEEHKNITLIANSFENHTLETLIANSQRGTIKCVAIEAPGFGIKRKWLLEDMAAITGGVFISRDMGRVLKSVTREELGTCDKVWSDVDKTQIIGGRGSKEQIEARIRELKSQREQVPSEFDKHQIDERLTKLTGGVAIIKVGAQTAIEMKEKYERILDAVEATKSAVAEGIVAGGGVATYYLAEVLRKEALQSDADIQAGIDIVILALEAPFKKLMSNSGITKFTYPGGGTQGTDVETGRDVDMFEAGIIDPKKVTRQAIENAASVAELILTCEGLITEAEDTKDKELNKIVS